MKQYLLAVHGIEDAPAPDPDEMQLAYAQVEVFNQRLQEAGALVFGGGLMPPSTATVVRMQEGKAVLTDGPFTETKEQLGGFWIIQAQDLDEALAWSAQAATACREPVEVRPFQDESEV
jgi:hypothetical protein